MVINQYPINSLNNHVGDSQGGPGGSSLFGLFIEHGPFSVDANLNLVERYLR